METIGIVATLGPVGRQLRIAENQVNIVNPRKLEHGFRMIHAGIPYTLL